MWRETLKIVENEIHTR